MRLTQQTVSTQIKLAAGDVVQIAVAQNTGAGLAVDGLPGDQFLDDLGRKGVGTRSTLRFATSG